LKCTPGGLDKQGDRSPDCRKGIQSSAALVGERRFGGPPTREKRGPVAGENFLCGRAARPVRPIWDGLDHSPAEDMNNITCKKAKDQIYYKYIKGLGREAPEK